MGGTGQGPGLGQPLRRNQESPWDLRQMRVDGHHGVVGNAMGHIGKPGLLSSKCTMVTTSFCHKPWQSQKMLTNHQVLIDGRSSDQTTTSYTS